MSVGVWCSSIRFWAFNLWSYGKSALWPVGVELPSVKSCALDGTDWIRLLARLSMSQGTRWNVGILEALHWAVRWRAYRMAGGG